MDDKKSLKKLRSLLGELLKQKKSLEQIDVSTFLDDDAFNEIMFQKQQLNTEITVTLNEINRYTKKRSIV